MTKVPCFGWTGIDRKFHKCRVPGCNAVFLHPLAMLDHLKEHIPIEYDRVCQDCDYELKFKAKRKPEEQPNILEDIQEEIETPPPAEVRFVPTGLSRRQRERINLVTTATNIAWAASEPGPLTIEEELELADQQIQEPENEDNST